MKRRSYHFPSEHPLVVITLHLFVHGVHHQLLESIYRETLESEEIHHVNRVFITAKRHICFCQFHHR